VKKACEYRAKKLGDYWLRIGSSDGSQFYCRTNVSLKVTGDICPCGVMPQKAVGNIYRESLVEIFEKHRDYLMFNEQIKGACGSCSNKDVCFGCRANAYHYLGDELASDPKCWLNPETEELYFRQV
ncbi:MAG: SPASM domain-containing protein, partial [Candidatus Binatia bacterium]